jgi:hypothetical protein
VDCSDGVDCTVDTCDEAADACVYTANDNLCADDGLFCNGTEFCDTGNDCSSTGDPCSAGTTCDDATDACVSEGNGPCAPGDDSDGDGVCTSGSPPPADNCPSTANPGQEDDGGFNTGVPDGIGNACQCGDVNGDGSVNNTDGTIIKRCVLGLSPCEGGGPELLPSPGNCDVNGDGVCNTTDGTIVKRNVVGLSPADVVISQKCPSAQHSDPVLEGTVTNDMTGVGLAAVNISIDGLALSTAADGTYSAFLPSGVYTVSFERENFESHTETVVLFVESTVTLDVGLMPTVPVIVSAGVAGEAAPGAMVTATATVELLDGSTVESISWTQVESVTVTIDGADTDTATVTLPDEVAYKDELMHVLAEPLLDAGRERDGDDRRGRYRHRHGHSPR